MKKGIILIALLIASILMSACSAGGDWDTSAPAPSYETTSPATTTETSDPSYAPAETPGYDDSYWETDPSGESYLVINENLAVSTDVESTLTFSLKVDTAAYTNIARFIENGQLPPRDAVRTEELINYFSFDNRMEFNNDSPFAISVEVGPSPFNENRHLAFVRVSTIDIDRSELPPSNLTFLIDTSGSMSSHDKLPLLIQSFSLLVENLTENDRVSIVTYAGSSGVLLDGVSGADKDRILSALDGLRAGGSTAGAQGIKTAYALAESNYIEGANNRVILATDGDFNVGVSSNDELAKLIGNKRDSGIYLSILGFGMGNIRDDLMETLSREGNGNYFYINNLRAARKALVDELTSNLYTVADDVKAQVEFNPQNVKSYRLIGYENRRLSNRDFDDDTVDAGEIGAGTDVVMMFELELYGSEPEGYRRYSNTNETDESDEAGEAQEPDFANELFDVRIRYKNPGESKSMLISHQVFFDDIVNIGSADFRFASAVAAFGHLLRGSEYAGNLTINDILAMAEDGIGPDYKGYRGDFLRLLEMYKRIS